MNLKYGWQYMQYSLCHMVWAELPLRGDVDGVYIVNISKSSSVECNCISVEMTSVDILSTLCFFASGCLRVPPYTHRQDGVQSPGLSVQLTTFRLECSAYSPQA
jgi:hypothetical protein